ncbi:MAG: DNA recombination protein RmuC, partial [Pseudomonadota bacterium]
MSLSAAAPSSPDGSLSSALAQRADALWQDGLRLADAMRRALDHPEHGPVLLALGAMTIGAVFIVVRWRAMHAAGERAEAAERLAKQAADEAAARQAQEEAAALEMAAQKKAEAAAEAQAAQAALVDRMAGIFADQQATLQSRIDGQLAELRGRIATLSELDSARQNEFAQTLDRRLNGVTNEVGRQLSESRSALDSAMADVRSSVGTGLAQTHSDVASTVGGALNETQERLQALHERLAVIDQTQSHLSDLTSRVVDLQTVLSDKQARGAYGQGRMEMIIRDALPRSAYALQATLSNGKRPDCIIHLPNSPLGLVVDAKFPLEGFEALRLAQDAASEAGAMQAVRTAMTTHVADIAGKYLIAGETQDTALMFVPSEAIYAELHERFPDLIQAAHRARVFIVSPNMLMLAIQTMQAILKDVKMREAAGELQREVQGLMKDVGAVVDRVKDLERHHGQTGTALDKLN